MGNRLPTLAEYYKKYVNENVDLDKISTMPCEFHKEQHGKSFAISSDKKHWRCYGKCHTGGGIYELHQLNFKLKSLDEAKRSLNEIYGIDNKPTFTKVEVEVNESEVRRRTAYATALRYARTINDWLELDYIMSMSPPDVLALETFSDSRKR